MLLEMRLVNINDKWWNGHFTVDFEIKQEIYLDLCVIKNNLPNEEKNKKKPHFYILNDFKMMTITKILYSYILHIIQCRLK